MQFDECAGGTAQANSVAIQQNVQTVVSQAIAKALAAVAGNNATSGSTSSGGGPPSGGSG